MVDGKAIRGEKISLRLIQEKDLPLLHKWANDPKIKPFWYGRDKSRSREWVRRHFMPMITGENPSECWIIEAEKEAIGFMYNTPDRDDDGEFTGRVELDILIGDIDKWGKGYGTDALRTMLKYAFGQQKAERAYLTPRISNERAIRVYEKAGFKKEGVLRHFEKFEGKWVDCIMMGILKSEYEKRN